MNGDAAHRLVDKEAFLAARSCLTQGWFLHHAAPEPPGPGVRWRFFAGADVARRARTWLGEGRYLPRAPVDAALQATTEAVGTGTSALLFEASFSWDGLIARADAIRRSDGGWTLVEVKSGKSSEDGAVKDEYLDDMAYTACVAAGAGLPLTRAALILINGNYRDGGSDEMFTEIDVTREVVERAALFRERAPAITRALAAEHRPEPMLKFACRQCGFFADECVGKDIPDPLFVLPRLSEKKFADLHAYERISRLPATVALTEPQQRVADVVRSGMPQIDLLELRGILAEVTWPVRYLDFEAVMPPLPWFAASPPYDVVPFQYSLHIRQSAADVAEHREYLAATDDDWRRHFTECLLVDLGTAGSIVVYSSYEKTRLAALATLFPDLRPMLEQVIARLFDLERVFKKGYCHPGFAGRTSIKKVLPVMVPGLHYSALEVNNGDDAAGVFALMQVGEYPPETHDEHRARLLAYCKLDTTALVLLHEAVVGIL